MGSSINLADLGEKLPYEAVNFHRSTVADLLQRHQTTFPGAQPVSFSRHHLTELTRNDYFLCEKTDGIRCLLYCTQVFNNGPGGPPSEVYFLIDRKNDYYAIAQGYLHLPRPGPDVAAFHPGTILDGELVRDVFPDGREQITYLIFDCLALDNQNIMERQFDVRIGKVRNFVYEPWKAFKKDWPQEAEIQPFQIALKQMELPYAAQMMFVDRIPTLTHGNDGLIFTCCTTPYAAGTDKHILKWKPPHENTIDFRVHIGAFPLLEDEDGTYEDWDAQPAMDLYVNHGNKDYRAFAPLAMTPAEWEAFKTMNQQMDGRIIECYRDASSGNWRAKLENDGTPRFRDDKTDANHISTVNSVLESIKDAVSQEELVAAAGQIRAAYKERQEDKKRRAGERKRAAHHQQQQQRRPTEPQRKPTQPMQAPEEVDEGPMYED